MARLPKNPLVSEVLRAAHGAKTKDKKISILKEHKGDHFKALFVWNYDSEIKINNEKPSQLHNNCSGKHLGLSLIHI